MFAAETPAARQTRNKNTVSLFILPPRVLSEHALGGHHALNAGVDGRGFIQRPGKTFEDRLKGMVDFPGTDEVNVEIKSALVHQSLEKFPEKTGLLFSCIGGPISRLVGLDNEALSRNESSNINGVFDDGISATVDGSEMLAGSAEFLALHGIKVNAKRDARDSDESNGVLYVSIDGKLAARYYIKYRPDRDFVRMVNMLGDIGVAVGIRTGNPSVNSDIIAKRCPEMRYKVYTIKSRTAVMEDIDSDRETTESGLYAKNKAVFLSAPLAAVKGLKKIYRNDR